MTLIIVLEVPQSNIIHLGDQPSFGNFSNPPALIIMDLKKTGKYLQQLVVWEVRQLGLKHQVVTRNRKKKRLVRHVVFHDQYFRLLLYSTQKRRLLLFILTVFLYVLHVRLVQ